jgi:hypothetical protein
VEAELDSMGLPPSDDVFRGGTGCCAKPFTCHVGHTFCGAAIGAEADCGKAIDVNRVQCIRNKAFSIAKRLFSLSNWLQLSSFTTLSTI